MRMVLMRGVSVLMVRVLRLSVAAAVRMVRVMFLHAAVLVRTVVVVPAMVVSVLVLPLACLLVHMLSRGLMWMSGGCSGGLLYPAPPRGLARHKGHGLRLRRAAIVLTMLRVIATLGVVGRFSRRGLRVFHITSRGSVPSPPSGGEG
jgi:hypothetical protein